MQQTESFFDISKIGFYFSEYKDLAFCGEDLTHGGQRFDAPSRKICD